MLVSNELGAAVHNAAVVARSLLLPLLAELRRVEHFANRSSWNPATPVAPAPTPAPAVADTTPSRSPMQPIPENGPIHTAADARIPPLTEVYQTVHLKEFTDFPKKDEKDPTTVFTDIHFKKRSVAYEAYHLSHGFCQ